MGMTWISYRPDRVAEGKRVVAYPDHRGYSAPGVIRKVTINGLWVEYDGHGPVLLDRDGKYSAVIDCCLDINLIEYCDG